MTAPRRIVSLCPSITETIVALGGLKRLVAATRYCVRPQGLLWGLHRIGGTKDPRISQILDLKPDLVFANEEENRLEDVRALEAAGIEVDVTFPKTVAEVPVAIRAWGRRLGVPEEAEAIAKRIVHVHAKDISVKQAEAERGKVTGTAVGCACGDGVIDWKRLVARLKKAGFKGTLSVECGTDEQAVKSLAHLTGVFKELDA